MKKITKKVQKQYNQLQNDLKHFVIAGVAGNPECKWADGTTEKMIRDQLKELEDAYGNF